MGEFAQAAKAVSDVLTFKEFVDGVLEPIRRAAGCSGALLYRYDERGIVGSLDGSSVEVTPRYATELFHVDPVQRALVERKRIGYAVVPRLFPDVDWAAYRGGDAYNELYGPHDVEDLLGLTLSDACYGSPNMSGFVLTRSRREPLFQADVVNQIDRLRPTLLAAVRRIERLAEARQREQALEAVIEHLALRATVIVDRIGRVVFLTRDANALLESAESKATFAGLAIAAYTQPEERVSFSFPGRQGLIRVEAQLVRAAGAHPYVVATLRSASSPVRSDLSQRWKLTRAETDVLALLADGLSNREIAARLFVSLETIRTHVSRVLAKSGARSRTQVLVLLRDET